MEFAEPSRLKTFSEAGIQVSCPTRAEGTTANTPTGFSLGRVLNAWEPKMPKGRHPPSPPSLLASVEARKQGPAAGPPLVRVPAGPPSKGRLQELPVHLLALQTVCSSRPVPGEEPAWIHSDHWNRTASRLPAQVPTGQVHIFYFENDDRPALPPEAMLIRVTGPHNH